MRKHIINEVMSKLKNNFPQYRFTKRNEIFTNDIVITVDSKELFLSDEYAEVIMDLTEKYFWAKEIYNIFFDYEDTYKIEIQGLKGLNYPHEYSNSIYKSINTTIEQRTIGYNRYFKNENIYEPEDAKKAISRAA